ncbi:MAG: GldG family protein [Patescibacteria group bacterium]
MLTEKNIKKQYRRNAYLAIVLLIGGVIIANILAHFNFVRFDLTANKDYSLSTASKDMVRQLDKDVFIKVYFSNQLPPEYLAVRQEAGDLLDEYKNYGGTHLQIQYIDPADDAVKKELATKGVPELQFNILEKDQFQLTNGYLGIIVSQGKNEQVLPVIDSTANFEYKITSAISKVISDNNFTIAWAMDLQASTDKYQQVVSSLQDNYTITSVNLENGLISEDYQTLVVAGYESELSDTAKYAIDQFLMRGGNVFIMQDAYNVNQYLQAVPNTNGLSEMLKSWGVEVSDKIVLDSFSEVANFSGGVMTFMVPYPYWIKITSDGFNKDQTAVSDLESLSLPWASYLTLDQSIHEVVPLVSSSSNSWLSGDQIDLSPQQTFKANGKTQVYTLSALVTGQFNSYFQDKNKPVSDANYIEQTSAGRLLVIGDADYATDQFVSRNSDNYIFLANMLDWLNQDSALIEIRSKGITDRSIQELTANEKTTIKYLNIFGITGIVILIGLINFIIRRKNGRKLKISFK